MSQKQQYKVRVVKTGVIAVTARSRIDAEDFAACKPDEAFSWSERKITETTPVEPEPELLRYY